MTYAIVVADATKRYGDFVALDHVDFVVPTGSLTALLGPSGSGKSTLLRTIAGLDQPDTGTITINGRDVTRVPPQRRGIGFVFQHYAAFKHLTVRDNVAFGLKIRKRPKAEIKAKVDNLLQVVGLSGFQSRYPNQLSGGQRQRMALARALAVDPEVLLLDEPFGALDAKVREELRAWLRRLHDEVHVTTVLVTHDQAEALDVADRIAVLHKGRIEQVGSPTDVYDAPANAFVMSFLGAVSTLNGSLVRPHDIRVGRTPNMAVAAADGTAGSTGVLRAVVDRVVVLGFEVRVELTSAATGGAFTAQITRGDAEALALREGDTVYVRATRVPPIAGGVSGVDDAGVERVKVTSTLSRGRRARPLRQPVRAVEAQQQPAVATGAGDATAGDDNLGVAAVTAVADQSGVPAIAAVAAATAGGVGSPAVAAVTAVADRSGPAAGPAVTPDSYRGPAVAADAAGTVEHADRAAGPTVTPDTCAVAGAPAIAAGAAGAARAAATTQQPTGAARAAATPDGVAGPAGAAAAEHAAGATSPAVTPDRHRGPAAPAGAADAEEPAGAARPADPAAAGPG